MRLPAGWQCSPATRSCAGGSGNAGAEDMRTRFTVDRMADEIDRRLPPSAPVRVLHIHKLTGVSGSEGHLLALLPALRARGVDARFLGFDVPGTDAPRFYEALDELGVPHESVRCGADVSPRMARDVIRARARRAPRPRCTPISSTRTCTARSRRAA